MFAKYIKFYFLKKCHIIFTSILFVTETEGSLGLYFVTLFDPKNEKGSSF